MSDKRLSQRALREMGIAEDQITAESRPRPMAEDALAALRLVTKAMDALTQDSDQYGALEYLKQAYRALTLAATEPASALHPASGDPTAVVPAPPLDVEELGFADLLSIAEALLTKYPPGTIVCTHDEHGDIGARTAAAIGDLVASCHARLAEQPKGVGR